MPRFFTLEEARRFLPPAGRLIREAVQSKERAHQAESAISNLTQRILVMGGMSVDTQLAESWKTQREVNEQTLKTSLERLDEIGCVVKDLDVGLVDFPTLLRGEEVYLCWRMDEDDIRFWHSVHEGFAGRQRIDAQFLENHRGDQPA